MRRGGVRALTATEMGKEQAVPLALTWCLGLSSSPALHQATGSKGPGGSSTRVPEAHRGRAGPPAVSIPSSTELPGERCLGSAHRLLLVPCSSAQGCGHMAQGKHQQSQKSGVLSRNFSMWVLGAHCLPSAECQLKERRVALPSAGAEPGE